MKCYTLSPSLSYSEALDLALVAHDFSRGGNHAYVSPGTWNQLAVEYQSCRLEGRCVVVLNNYDHFTGKSTALRIATAGDVVFVYAYPKVPNGEVGLT